MEEKIPKKQLIDAETEKPFYPEVDPDDVSEGKSAYDLAVKNGFEGSESEWLASLKGEPGAPGPAGSITAINEQKLVFQEADKLENIESEETVKVAFGKLRKALSVLIVHLTQKATASILGHVKLSNSAAINVAGEYALDALEKNASVDGTLANQIGLINMSLSSKVTVYTTLAELNVSILDETLFPIQEAFIAMKDKSEMWYTISGGHKFTNLGDVSMGGLLQIIRHSSSCGYAYFYQFNPNNYKKYEKYMHTTYEYVFVKTCEGEVIS